ncbi:medium-chain acyl-CoA ligase ACSF2, mitochondrial isoform X3 [Phymastichus coffea]|uniref:medium-chain acyl-CoA ligase ACSF2, mitochondrial isoform X3 n=1 Tax=Phymastichus coffea TaxID=108790 RepID=UPI00273BBFF6|nr:medium-chain acyl-CoA ligase ACSF2, mitochondrial isoform X3 [Phymastichus coffea]
MKNREERKADDSDTTALRAEWSANARAAYTCACTPTARCLQCCENRWVTLATHFRSSAAELMRVLVGVPYAWRPGRSQLTLAIEARKQKEAERSSRLNRTLFEDCRSARCAIHQKRCLRLEIPNVNQAYIKNPGVVPLQEMTIGQLLETAAERYPNRHSVISVHQNQRLTFSQLLQRADRIAAGFKRIGLKKGDRIGIWGPNDYQWLLAYMASSRAGLVIAGLNPMYQFGELDYCLNKIGARAVVAPESYRSQNYADMLLAAKKTSPRLDHVVIYGGAHVAGTRRLDDIENLPSRIEVEAVREEQADISPWSGTNIQFTSGTTGVSKATLLAHRSLVNNSAQGMRRLQLDGDKICMNVPFFHAFGMVMAVSGHLHTGTTIVLESPTFNPAKSVEAVMREKCSVVFGTPTMWTNMIDVQTRAGARIDSVRTGVTGGAPASPELFKRIREHFAFDRLTTAFGLTETTALVNQTLPGEPTELTDTTVGFISDHVEIKVTDDEGGTVPFGRAGELRVRGYNVMLGYWADEEATARTITADGWLRSGDRYVLREDGYGQIVGRIKDMLIRGGENIFPKEIECFLESHPAVLEVHAFGVHDDVYGEEICACVRLRDGARLTADELRRYCAGKIAKFKIPRYILFSERFPKTASGKIQKFRLREALEAEGVVPTKRAQ